MAGTNPRAARIAALIQRVVASSIERELHDKRLASITVTEVRVTNDLQIAKVYWTQLGHEGLAVAVKTGDVEGRDLAHSGSWLVIGSGGPPHSGPT